ncbi:hypothetical protein JTE90_020706 [Oedothorax gibbosus]|uniref:Uncharacterized protein n=1 Tax=Oedothorax gibbosus TaxID=931172 RepID=A0AAV6V741_9ARAC|nr:hypothetical protein JTE90_020706 [Oedothorax gibbosus]
MMLNVALLLCLLSVGIDAKSIKRNAGDNPICSKTQPCGWEIYKPYIRTVLYFMKSPCECPVNTQCQRSSDDISISAYVHLCASTDDKRS